MGAFSLMECAEDWEHHVYLRKRGRSQQVLVQDCKSKKNVLPTLKNIRYNADVLRPLTQKMASQGIISSSVKFLKPALKLFYEEQLAEEERRKPDTELKIISKANSSAFYIKRMLSVVKKKWAKWEMPRAP